MNSTVVQFCRLVVPVCFFIVQTGRSMEAPIDVSNHTQEKLIQIKYWSTPINYNDDTYYIGNLFLLESNKLMTHVDAIQYFDDLLNCSWFNRDSVDCKTAMAVEAEAVRVIEESLLCGRGPEISSALELIHTLLLNGFPLVCSIIRNALQEGLEHNLSSRVGTITWLLIQKSKFIYKSNNYSCWHKALDEIFSEFKTRILIFSGTIRENALRILGRVVNEHNRFDEEAANLFKKFAELLKKGLDVHTSDHVFVNKYDSNNGATKAKKYLSIQKKFQGSIDNKRVLINTKYLGRHGRKKKDL